MRVWRLLAFCWLVLFVAVSVAVSVPYMGRPGTLLDRECDTGVLHTDVLDTAVLRMHMLRVEVLPTLRIGAVKDVVACVGQVFCGAIFGRNQHV